MRGREGKEVTVKTDRVSDSERMVRKKKQKKSSVLCSPKCKTVEKCSKGGAFNFGNRTDLRHARGEGIV